MSFLITYIGTDGKTRFDIIDDVENLPQGTPFIILDTSFDEEKFDVIQKVFNMGYAAGWDANTTARSIKE